MIDDFLLNSLCAIKKREKKYLYKLLGSKRLVTTLLYCGSIHGWNAKEFHSRCDNKGPTISLFKVKDGDCIGGYTEAQWSSPKDTTEYIDDSDAMIFNLTSSRNFPSTGGGIKSFCIYGPCFTEGTNNRLSAETAAFDRRMQCISWAVVNSGYYIQMEGEKNMLTN